LNIFFEYILSGDICRRSLKSSEIEPIFACFIILAPKIFCGSSPKCLDPIFKTQPTADHDRAKFCTDLPVELGDTVAKKFVKNKTFAVKHKSASKTIISRWTKKQVSVVIE